jgi:hypothetical protein
MTEESSMSFKLHKPKDSACEQIRREMLNIGAQLAKQARTMQQGCTDDEFLMGLQMVGPEVRRTVESQVKALGEAAQGSLALIRQVAEEN